MAASVVLIECHVLDSRTLWCESCQLPSVLEVDLAFVWPDTLELFRTFTESTCLECGE